VLVVEGSLRRGRSLVLPQQSPIEYSAAPTDHRTIRAHPCRTGGAPSLCQQIAHGVGLRLTAGEEVGREVHRRSGWLSWRAGDATVDWACRTTPTKNNGYHRNGRAMHVADDYGSRSFGQQVA
jgi:hypothetical protein